ncbi:MAG: hypothetical protein R3324_17320, partial [Halobacteriales archaeon]|nr:hypothetical protein [Halobacteriales archaeon]
MSCNLKCTPVKAVTAFTRVLGQEERTKINALVVALNDLIDDVEVTYKSARSVGYFPRVFGEGAAVTTGTFHLGHMPQQGCFEKVLIGVDGAGAADAEFAIKKNGTAITTSNLTLSAGGLYVASTTFGT